MGTEVENAVKIAVIEEQIKGVRDQNTAHAKAVGIRFDSMEKKLDELTAIMNRGKGAYAVAIIVSGAIGALLLNLISWLSPHRA